MRVTILLHDSVLSTEGRVASIVIAFCAGGEVQGLSRGLSATLVCVIVPELSVASAHMVVTADGRMCIPAIDYGPTCGSMHVCPCWSPWRFVVLPYIVIAVGQLS